MSARNLAIGPRIASYNKSQISFLLGFRATNSSQLRTYLTEFKVTNMKELFALVMIYLIYLILTYLLYKKVINMKASLMYFYLVGYLIFTYLYFELINETHSFLRDHGYYLDLGHAKMLHVMINIIL